MDITIKRLLQHKANQVKQTFGIISCDDFMCLSIERPNTQHPTLSRLPQGQYNYSIVNKTPNCSLAYIRLKDTPVKIKVRGTYKEVRNPILVGLDLKRDAVGFSFSDQRQNLSELCRVAPQKGTITITDETK